MRPLRALALSAAALALTVGTLAGGAADARGTDPSVPVVGTCHDLTWAQYESRTDAHAPVPCSQAHQSLTIATITLAPDVQRTDDDAVASALSVRCGLKASERAGGWQSLARSLYRWAFFVPTKAQ